MKFATFMLWFHYALGLCIGHMVPWVSIVIGAVLALCFSWLGDRMSKRIIH